MTESSMPEEKPGRFVQWRLERVHKCWVALAREAIKNPERKISMADYRRIMTLSLQFPATRTFNSYENSLLDSQKIEFGSDLNPVAFRFEEYVRIIQMPYEID